MKKFGIVVILMMLAGSSNGQLLNWGWSLSSGEADGGDSGKCIATDTSGYLYTAGTFQSDSITFGSYVLHNNGPGDDIYICKLTTGGQFLWARKAGSTASLDKVAAITTDRHNNVIVTGYFSTSSINFDGTVVYNSPGFQSDIFVAKYDSNGNILWAIAYGGTNDEVSNSICADTLGNIYVAGWFSSDSLQIGTTLLPSSLGMNALVTKLDPAGNFLWTKHASGTGLEAFLGVSCDYAGNVVATGTFGADTLNVDSITLNNSSTGNGYDIFFVKYDSSGNTLWANSFGGSGFDNAASVSIDTAGNIFTCGYFFSPTISIPGTTINNSGLGDVFVAKLDGNGNYLWLKKASGSGNDQVFAGSLNANNEYVVSGWFTSLSLFSGSLVLNRLPIQGACDVLFLKFDANGNTIGGANAGGSGNCISYGVTSAENGNSYVTGVFFGQYMDVGSNSLVNSFTPGGSADVFVAEITGTYVSLNQMLESSQLQIFPNPVSDQLTIKFSSERKDVEIQVTDIAGNLAIAKHSIDASTQSISFNKLPAGIYLVTIFEAGCLPLHSKIVKIN